MVKNLPGSAGDARDKGSISWSGRSPGVGNGNLLQYSYLENSMDRGAWWATIRGHCKELDMTEHTQNRFVSALENLVHLHVFRLQHIRCDSLWQKRLITAVLGTLTGVSPPGGHHFLTKIWPHPTGCWLQCWDASGQTTNRAGTQSHP